MIARFVLYSGLCSYCLLGAGSPEVLASSQKNLSSKVLATVGKEEITYDKLEKAFSKNVVKKNSSFKDVSRDSVLNFLDLYINYRLKVQEAFAKGVDKDSTVQADLKQNRKLLAEPYFFDKMLTEPAVATMLKRRKEEVEIAVILIPSNGKDSAEALKRANAILKMVQAKNADFAAIARDSSADETTKKNGGKLNFATSGVLIKELEEVAYSLKPGQIYPEPVFTRFGYFVVKLERRLPRRIAKSSHILITPDKSAEDTTAAVKLAMAKADSLYKLSLNKKTDFAELAKSSSDDSFTAKDGGKIGEWYSRSTGFLRDGGRLVAEYEEGLFSLQQGQVSKPVRSAFGFHIIKADSMQSPTDDAEREEMRKLYKRLYLEQDKAKFLDAERKKRGYGWKNSTLDAFMASIDSTKTNLDSTWGNSVPQSLLNDTLYYTPKLPLRVVDLALALNERPDMRGYPLNRDGIGKAVNRLVEPKLLEDVTANLEKDYPEFAQLMQEFRDGTLIFRVEDEEIWSKQKFDTARAKAYFEERKSQYQTDLAYDMTEVYVYTDTAARRIAQAVRTGGDIGTFAEQETQRKGFREKKGARGFLSARSHNLGKVAADSNATVGAIIGPFAHENGYAVIKINDIRQPRQKTFEEALADFATVIQEQTQKEMTKAWLDRLRQKFGVTTNDKEIQSIWKK